MFILLFAIIKLEYWVFFHYKYAWKECENLLFYPPPPHKKKEHPYHILEYGKCKEI